LVLVYGRLRVGVEDLASGCDVLLLRGLPGRGVLPKASAASPQDVNGRPEKRVGDRGAGDPKLVRHRVAVIAAHERS
jgi:hypothetical protein